MRSEYDDTLIDEALHWLALLGDADVSADDRRAFEAWRARSRAHEAAWRRAQSVWASADLLKDSFEPKPGTRKATSGIRTPLRWAAAALVAVVTGAYLWATPSLFADHSTTFNERQSVTLSDGSVVELASRSSISVDFTETTRKVRLIEGEAFFQVVTESARPFVVEAARGQSTALGTAFNVKLNGEQVTVSVVEHAVAVSANATILRVEEGERISYGSGRVGRAQPTDLGATQAWRRDRLVFQDAPLRDVINDLERYRRSRVIIVDDSLGSIPVTAVFDAGQTEAALRTISQTLPIRLVDAAGLFVLVLRQH